VVDLEDVIKRLGELEKQKKAAGETIAKFCKERGIPATVAG